MSDARLILTWGLPGAGKTTFARQLAADRGAVRLTKDEWMWALGSTPWDGPTQQKVEHESLALEVSAEYIRNWPVFVLELDGQLLGFGGFLKVATKVFLNDLFVDPPWIGTGVGALLWNHAIDVARERSWASFDIESDPYAEGFYLKYGAVRIGDI